MVALTCDWLALDIETAGGRPEDADAWMRRQWSPNPNWKPETIGNRYLEMLAKKQERLALLDESPIIAVAVRTSTGETVCCHSMKHGPTGPVGVAHAERFDDEAQMLVGLRTFMDARADDQTTLCGHNVKRFDLARLRCAYLRNGLRPPRCLFGHDQAVFDTMTEYTRRFSADTDIMIALADLCERLRIPTHKGLMDGGQVPELFASGKHEEIVTYCLLDVICEAEVFLRLTGKSPGLK